MKKVTALKAIFIISIAGIIFSGYLSYSELFTGSCPLGGGCTSVVGIPACVYGFFMYMLVFIISLIGLNDKKK